MASTETRKATGYTKCIGSLILLLLLILGPTGEGGPPSRTIILDDDNNNENHSRPHKLCSEYNKREKISSSLHGPYGGKETMFNIFISCIFHGVLALQEKSLCTATDLPFLSASLVNLRIKIKVVLLLIEKGKRYIF